FRRVIPHSRVGYPRVPHPFATLQAYCYAFSFDLHVLSAPPAFVLSQDQTLIGVTWNRTKGHHFNTPKTELLFALFSFQRTEIRLRESQNLLCEIQPCQVTR